MRMYIVHTKVYTVHFVQIVVGKTKSATNLSEEVQLLKTQP